MRILLLLLFLLTSPAYGSLLQLTSVWQPLYLHGSDTEPMIQIASVPYVTRHSDPEWRFAALARPCRPAHDGTWTEGHDINLVSLYQIKVEGTYAETSPDIDVLIDARKAAVPEDFPFTISQVLQAIETCIHLMYPPRPESEGAVQIKILR